MGENVGCSSAMTGSMGRAHETPGPPEEKERAHGCRRPEAGGSPDQIPCERAPYSTLKRARPARERGEAPTTRSGGVLSDMHERPSVMLWQRRVEIILMVHRPAPLRLTGAFGALLLLAGIVTIVRVATGDDDASALTVAAVVIALGGWVLLRRDRLPFRQIGWLAVACTGLVSVAVAGRDVPYGAGYAYVCAAPFAFAAGRRVGGAMVAAVAVGLAAAFVVQAAHVDDPRSFGTYFLWWLTATASTAVVGVVTALIVGSLEAKQRELDDGFDRGVLGRAFIDLGGRWLRVNPALGEILGRSPDSLAGRPTTDMTHPDDQSVSLKTLREVTDGGQASVERRYVRPDGDVRSVIEHATLLRDAHGAPSGIYSEFEDITARRAAEEGMRASDRRFERAYEAAGVGMLLRALDGPTQKATRAAGELLGRAPAAVVGTSIAEWQHPDDRETGLAQARMLVARDEPDSFSRAARYVRADGRVVEVAVAAALVRDDHGDPAYVILQVADVSDREVARRREGALADLGRAALAAEGIGGLLKDSARVVAQTLDARYATVLDARYATVLDGAGNEVLAAH